MSVADAHGGFCPSASRADAEAVRDRQQDHLRQRRIRAVVPCCDGLDAAMCASWACPGCWSIFDAATAEQGIELVASAPAGITVPVLWTFFLVAAYCGILNTSAQGIMPARLLLPRPGLYALVDTSPGLAAHWQNDSVVVQLLRAGSAGEMLSRSRHDTEATIAGLERNRSISCAVFDEAAARLPIGAAFLWGASGRHRPAVPMPPARWLVDGGGWYWFLLRALAGQSASQDCAVFIGSPWLGQVAIDSVVNASAILVVIILVTYGFGLLYVARARSWMTTILVGSHVQWFSVFGFVLLRSSCLQARLPLDWLTAVWAPASLAVAATFVVFAVPESSRDHEEESRKPEWWRVAALLAGRPGQQLDTDSCCCCGCCRTRTVMRRGQSASASADAADDAAEAFAAAASERSERPSEPGQQALIRNGEIAAQASADTTAAATIGAATSDIASSVSLPTLTVAKQPGPASTALPSGADASGRARPIGPPQRAASLASTQSSTIGDSAAGTPSGAEAAAVTPRGRCCGFRSRDSELCGPRSRAAMAPSAAPGFPGPVPPRVRLQAGAGVEQRGQTQCCPACRSPSSACPPGGAGPAPPLTVSGLHWRVKRRFRQGRNCAMVLASAVMAWPFLSFPEGTFWSGIVAITIWDVFAVMAPCGPLGFIMRHESRRARAGRPSGLPPSLLFDGGTFLLGSGDLLLYAALFGRAIPLGWMAAWFTGAGLAGGVVATVAATMLTSRVLPALPIAVGLGIVLYAIGSSYMVPYTAAFQSAHVIV